MELHLAASLQPAEALSVVVPPLLVDVPKVVEKRLDVEKSLDVEKLRPAEACQAVERYPEPFEVSY